MSLIALAIKAVERGAVPDSLTRIGIAGQVGNAARALADPAPGAAARFAAEMEGRPIALHTDAANAQHYEVPPGFFGLVLGPQRKYSCCLYPTPATTLADAEELALAETAAHADLGDGQSILELGCGWGSLSLWMARTFRKARIVAVSNSHSQRAFIMGEAERLSLTNLEVVTADMNTFAPGGTFDRVVSVEMFEHMANWRPLLSRIRTWLKPDGRLFVHVFAHRTTPYRFDHNDSSDWIARHFFTGGLMPSHDLIRQFPDLFAVEAEWRWSGRHYQRTARDWLARCDCNAEALLHTLGEMNGVDARLLVRRWRLFFLATEGLFGYGGGSHWGVSHYRLRPASA